MKRLLTAAVGIPILFFAIKKGPLWICFAVVAIAAALAAGEACALLERPGRRPIKLLAMVGSILAASPFLVMGAFGAGTLAGASAAPILFTVPLIAALGASLLGAVILRRTASEMAESAVATFFPVMLVGFPLGFLVGLRGLSDEEMGRDLLVLLLVVIWVGDTAAYYVGSLIGRHRLAPMLSPRKSVEGAVAGVAGGILGAILAHYWWFHRLPIAHAVAIGILLQIIGIGGDLAESIFKRAAGSKDSSRLLPGHGGFLDRIDSLLFAGPALYYYYVVLLSHPTPS